MNKYLYVLVMWDDIIIGKIYKNEEEKYTYYPNYDSIFYAKDKGMPVLPHIIEPQLLWGEMPGMFSERISWDPEFKLSCRMATDKLILIKVK